MLGHHFRKIQDTIRPRALPRTRSLFQIYSPYYILGHTVPETQKQPFNLLTTHDYLKIRKGELKRFSLLYLETIKKEQGKTKDSKNLKLLNEWQDKIKAFEKIFLNSKIIFP